MSSYRFFSLCAVALALMLGTSSCGEDTTVLLRIEGSAPGATSLKLRLVDETGALPGIYNFPDNGGALELPGTILLKTGDNLGSLGIFLWAETGTGTPIAQVRSVACYRVVSGTQNKFTLELRPAPPAFSANSVQDCRCQGEQDMCAAPNKDVGGMGGNVPSSGGAGGINVGAGGSSGTGSPDGGTSTPDAASMGGNTVPPDATTQPDAAPVVAGSVFSFDHLSDWSSQETTLSLDNQLKTQGTSSLEFSAPQTPIFIRSRNFSTNELTGVSPKLALDVHVPGALGASDNLQLWFACEAAMVYNAYVQYRSLASLGMGWNQVTFDLPAPVVAALMGQHTGCRFWVHHEAAGSFRYDNLRFVP